MPTVSNDMALILWDLAGDPYDHTQLWQNFNSIAGHDHTLGRGKQIPSGGIANGAVTTEKIGANAVTADKIPDGSLTQAELATDSVGRPQLQADAVGSDEIEDGTIGFDELDPSILPVGTVIMWYRPNSGVPLPTGYEVCDGRPWTAVPNAWGVATGSMPDLRGKVPSGAALTGIGSGPNDPPDIGQIGGANTINIQHSHTVDGHTHTSPDHTHPDNHNHTGLTGTASGDAADNAIVVHYVHADTTLFNSDGGKLGLRGMPGFGHNHFIGAHAGPTGGMGGGNTGSASPGTNTQLSTVQSVRNAYVGLLFLMRVL